MWNSVYTILRYSRVNMYAYNKLIINNFKYMLILFINSPGNVLYSIHLQTQTKEVPPCS